MSQGCVKNQEAIFNALVVEDINFMLRTAKYKKCPSFKVLLRFRLNFFVKYLSLYFVLLEVGCSREAFMRHSHSVHVGER
jgi:hypothetical protein